MKYLIILCDGLSDRKVAELGDRTPLEAAHVPAMDLLARQGVTGMIKTTPEGLDAGSEVGNSVILGYDPALSYPGRGPLEAEGMGIVTDTDDLVVRCNIIPLSASGNILSHNAGEISDNSLRHLKRRLNDIGVEMIGGNGFRQLISIHGGHPEVICSAPHDHIGESISDLRPNATGEDGKKTAELLSQVVDISRDALSTPGYYRLLWPWGPGVRPVLPTLSAIHPSIVRSTMISAVPLIRGLGRLAGMDLTEVAGATGGADTDYAAKAKAAIKALEDHDLVYLHIEAPDDVSHSRDTAAKVRVIEEIDCKVVARIVRALSVTVSDTCVVLMPDHPTYVETGAHGNDDVPVAIWHRGIAPDRTQKYSEEACATGGLGIVDGRFLLKKLINRSDRKNF